MSTQAAIEQERLAWLLVSERLNATELALALEMTRQSALRRIRRIRQSRPGRSLSTATRCVSIDGGRLVDAAREFGNGGALR